MTAPGSTDRVLTYGPHDDQRIELTYPTGRHRGIAVLVHGGYWRAAFTADLMRPLVPTFTAHGWVVANVEYRRGSDGWAATEEDIGAALTMARSLHPDSRIAIVGHSVGGQLALLGGCEGDAVVALAPVTDLTRGYHEGIGDGAVAEFFRASPDDLPVASPLAQVPPRGEVLVVQGCDDVRVPIAHTRDYVEAARAAGGDVEYLELPRLSHLDAINPAASHWPDVFTWLHQRAPLPRASEPKSVGDAGLEPTTSSV